ncbi:two-component sensory box histidine kinase/response regulator [Desulforapulum autotrophicum HRM2]|uniref:Two-component sensory box histidine kinase/response regulator n=1 Tax=Desulforapulum autotrophicum (strain ATCC 43914 / DSM 3382 / VKM B-1955 / HRM2) TaxID=177437 RepID=C0QAU3_DESAH|nr:response regulator [Desulforapulum autotrophicum]ACN16876.1 two-component sensory box histidine kinase/response regulator [Desulforapulum autotrophicum HRM2]
MDNITINLLVVDDEEEFLDSITRSLSVRNFKVVAVNRGEKAIEAVKAHDVDVALVDLKMPGINGEETLAALKKEKEGLEVIILTGHGTIDSAIECTRIGAFAFLQKPCELKELLDTLHRAYEKKQKNIEAINEQRIKGILKSKA